MSASPDIKMAAVTKKASVLHSQSAKDVNALTQASLNDHHCGLVCCIVCQKYVEPSNHQCYIQPVETRNRQAAQHSTNNKFLDDDVAVEDDGGNDKRDQSLIFFYFECTQDDGQHIPNLCVVQNESGDENVFLGPNTKDKFCE